MRVEQSDQKMVAQMAWRMEMIMVVMTVGMESW